MVVPGPSLDEQKLVRHSATATGLASAHPDDSQYTIIIEDLLLSTLEFGVYGRSNGIWCADQFLGSDLGW